MNAFRIWTVAVILAAGNLCSMAAAESPGEAFEALAAEFDAHEKALDPIAAGRDGDLEALGQWPETAPDKVAARQETEAGFSRRLAEIDADELEPEQRVSHEVMAYLLDSRASLADFGHQRMAFTSDSGFHSTPIRLAASTRPSSADEAEAWIRRLEKLPEYFEGHRQWLKKGAEKGFVQPRPIVERVIDQLETIAGQAPGESDFMEPIKALPSGLDSDRRDELTRKAREAIEEKVLPTYTELAGFLRDKYLAEPRESLGISEVPDGRDYYRALVAYHTSLEMTPEEIHEQGKAEVERIRAEMAEVIDETGFEGDFEAFLDYLRTDEQFYADSAEELLMRASRIAKLADDAMPRYFRRLPRLPYGVRPVPDSMAPDYTTGRYWPGNPESGEAGGYMVNTHALDQRPLYELPALTVHEAVPGHHHQIALAQELEDVPEFRRGAGITAYSEGWALYTEFLAEEMGIYRTPYEQFGRLTYEMWRACRLVVDTGIHWYGWSREQAEACLLDNSALAPHNVRTEVSRYISWPGQALAYKTGEILIRELREQAEETLGDSFDLRDFHDHILAPGAIPLSALRSRMEDWIEQQHENGT